MSGPEAEWNFVSYMACFGRKVAPATLRLQNNTNTRAQGNHNNSIEEQKVFAELRPANSEKDNLHNGNGSKYQSNYLGNPGDIEMPFNRPYNEKITCIDSSSLLEARSRSNEQNYKATECQQQLFSLDMKFLPPFDAELIPFNTVKSAQKISTINDSKMLTNAEESQSFMIQGFQQYLNFSDGFDSTEDDFKFPACVEEEYERMVQASKQEAPQKLPCIESIFNIGPQQYGKENSKSESGNVGCANRRTSPKGPVIIQSSEKGGNRPKPRERIKDPKMYEAREVEADISNEAELACASVDDIKNIESILDLINPAKDIMGKTFHKIPSTQPIYNDNDGHRCENNDENRVRRPMNAFMLWARKYRSLVAKEFSDASNSEISVKLGEIWNELSSEQQKPYFQKAEALKANHKQNHPNYVYQPRQTRFKQPRRCKTGNENEDKEENETEASQSISADFMKQLTVSRTMKLESTHNIGHVARTVVLSQDGNELDLAQHISKQPQLLAPKPMYPDGVRPCNHGEQDNGRQTGTEPPHRAKYKKRAYRSNQYNSTCYERDDYGEAEVGLLRDAMLPSFDKNMDDCDLISAAAQVFDVMDLDAYLTGVNDSDFGNYVEKHVIFEDDQCLSIKCSRVKLPVKKKRAVKQLDRASRKKPRIVKGRQNRE